LNFDEVYLIIKRKEVAYHEAGHAVIGYRMGHYFTNVWIAPDEEIVRNHSSTDEEISLGKVQYNSPDFERLVSTKTAEIDDRSEYERWHQAMVEYCLQTFSGCIAEYYIKHSVGESLPDDVWEEELFFSIHYIEMNDLLIQASESEFYPDFFSDSFLDEQIKNAEVLVIDEWNTISLLAEELIEERGLDWEEVDELIREAEDTTS